MAAIAAALAGIVALGLGAYQWTGTRAPQPAEAVAPAATRQQAPAPAASERAFTSFEPNTDRPGGDYTSLNLPDADPIACQKLCAEDQRCLAWTYVAPGYQEANAVCWLKNTVPAGTRTDACCTSGVAYYRRPGQ
jgi:hypothetical protein